MAGSSVRGSALLSILGAPVPRQVPWCPHKDLHRSCGATAGQSPVTSRRVTGHSSPPALPRWNRRTQSKRLGITSRRSDEDVASHPCRRRQLLPPCLATPLLAAPRTTASQSAVSSPQSSERSLKISLPPLPRMAPLLPKPHVPVGEPLPEVVLATRPPLQLAVCPPPRTGSGGTCSKQIHKFFKERIFSPS